MPLTAPADDSRIAHFLPQWHFREKHEILLDAPPEDVMRAMRSVTWAEAPLARALLLFSRNRISADGRILDQFAAGGSTVLDVTDDEFVYGGIGTLKGTYTPESEMRLVFRDFAEPGHTKVAFNLRYAAGRLTTETRVLATDPATRANFGRYWLLIRLPSGAIRRALLRAVQRRLRDGR